MIRVLLAMILVVGTANVANAQSNVCDVKTGPCSDFGRMMDSAAKGLQNAHKRMGTTCLKEAKKDMEQGVPKHIAKDLYEACTSRYGVLTAQELFNARREAVKECLCSVGCRYIKCY